MPSREKFRINPLLIRTAGTLDAEALELRRKDRIVPVAKSIKKGIRGANRALLKTHAKIKCFLSCAGVEGRGKLMAQHVLDMRAV